MPICNGQRFGPGEVIKKSNIRFPLAATGQQ